MTKLHQLAELGQAVWFDFIRRSTLASGELQALVDQGVRGVTSNPTIFEHAITAGDEYDDEIRALAQAGRSTVEIYEALAINDIRSAADILRPVYDATGGADGYVSLEVDPRLAHDTAGTCADAVRLFRTVDRPNLMIKVPATPAGIPAIQTLIGQGVNVNVTLIFSLDHYQDAARAYIAGLEELGAADGDVGQVASVASLFISRVDTAVDRALDEAGNGDLPALAGLQGKIALANAKMAYARFEQLFSGPRWEALATRGARVQRPLWASTSTKNPAYPDTLYVDDLVGPHTVNTMPPATLEAYLDHGQVPDSSDAAPVTLNWDQARAQLARLAELGIDLKAIMDKLQDEGVASFARSFESLLASIAEKRQLLEKQPPRSNP